MCTTELGDFANRNRNFAGRGQLIGVSVDSVESPRGCSANIAETQGQALNYALSATRTAPWPARTG